MWFQINLWKLICNDKKTNETKISNLTKPFHKTFFKKQSVRSEDRIDQFLGTRNVLKLSEEWTSFCEKEIKPKMIYMIH